MAKVIEKSRGDFTVRRDFVSIGIKHRDIFNIVDPILADNTRPDNLNGLIRVMSAELKAENRMNAAYKYQALMKSLRDFTNGEDIAFERISPEFISSYNDWLEASGYVSNTTAFYLRTLQTVLKKAREKGLADLPTDLFKGINTAHSRNPIKSATERSLEVDELKRIINLDLAENKQMELARDVFMFSFYCQGIEFKEITTLTTDNIQGNYLIFNRRGN